ncbi:hypothetical protein [Pseudomonas sp. NPDC087336]|uniref:hypothetical protein n=1 Tax=Pseudomonas sp. NPDC087336 TaxID=3364436 RepID=UPI0038253732
MRQLAEVLNKDFYRAFRKRLSEFLNAPNDASDSDIHEMINAGFSADRISACVITDRAARAPLPCRLPRRIVQGNKIF